MTNDVEIFSIPLNRLSPDTAREVYEVGLPRLLDAYAKHDIRCTFYFTGKIVEMVPEAVELVLDHGMRSAAMDMILPRIVRLI